MPNLIRIFITNDQSLENLKLTTNPRPFAITIRLSTHRNYGLGVISA